MRQFVVLLLISIILAGLTDLFAQQTSIQLNNAALVIPSIWEFQYEPPEVLLSVTVQPDSSLALNQILDGKQELQYLLQEHFKVHQYLVPVDSLIPGKQLTVLLPLDQKPDAVQQALGGPDLEEIEAWIDERRSITLIGNRNYSDPKRFDNAQFAPYQADYFHYGLSSDVAHMSVNGFAMQGSYFGSSFYTGLLERLYDSQEQVFSTDYSTPDIPQGITLSEIQAGLGYYEHRFARGTLARKNLFNYKDLRLSFDFLLQNGDWLEQASSGSAIKATISVPLGKTTLDMEFTDFVDQTSMLQLRPEYWQNTNYSVEERYRLYYLSWQNPWVDLALLGSTETISSEAFENTLYHDALRIKAFKELQISSFDLAAAFEHKFSQQAEPVANTEYSDLLDLNAHYAGLLFEADAGVQLLDFQRLLLQGQGSYSVLNLHLQPFFKVNLDFSEPLTLVPDIFNEQGYLQREDHRQRFVWGMKAQYPVLTGLDLDLTLAHKRIANFFIIILPQTEQKEVRESDVPFLALAAHYLRQWDKWTAQWSPSFTAQLNTADLYNEPAFRYQSSVSVSRDLGYNNVLKAGFDCLGHTAYTASDATAFQVGTSFIGDLWLAVQISTRFELQVTWKNFTNTTIYGAYPLPSSLRAAVRVYFLN